MRGWIASERRSRMRTEPWGVSTLTRSSGCNTRAMTGELTLTGRILPVGGMKGKLLAAPRSGVKTAVFPEKNRHDLVDVPGDVMEDLEIVFADEFDEVVGMALKGWKTGCPGDTPGQWPVGIYA